jgi:hypothetical protein
MTDDTPTRETSRQRARRLAEEAKNIVGDIDAALSEHGDTTQEENRRRIDEELERQFPGVTEDEQNPTGMYMPDPRNFKQGKPYRVSSDYLSTHSPMRRQVRIDGLEWTNEEEAEYQRRADIAARTLRTGTGEWWDSEEGKRFRQTWDEITGFRAGKDVLDLSPEYDRSKRGSKSSLGFVAAMSDDTLGNQTEVDIENVRYFAKRHHLETLKNRSQSEEPTAHPTIFESDTEWRNRYYKVLDDVENDTYPVNEGLLQEYGPAGVSSVAEYRKQINLNKLRKVWDDSLEYWHSEDARQKKIESSGPVIASNDAEVIKSFVHPHFSLAYIEDRPSQQGDFFEGAEKTLARGFRTTNKNQTLWSEPATTSRGTYIDSDIGMLNVNKLRAKYLPRDNDQNVLYYKGTPIAWRQRDNQVIVPVIKENPTASRHQQTLHDLLGGEGIKSPQKTAVGWLVDNYERDRHQQTAGQLVGLKHYIPEFDAYNYGNYLHFEDGLGTNFQTIAEKIKQNQLKNVVEPMKLRNAQRAANSRPRNNRQSMMQQQRLEMGGQLRLPLEQQDKKMNKRIMQYPISRGYSGVRNTGDDAENNRMRG